MNMLLTFLWMFWMGSTSISQPQYGVEEFLSSDIQVISKSVKSDIVAIELFIKDGIANLNEQNEGIEMLLLNSAVRGSKKYPKDQLVAELTKMGTEINISGNTDFSIVSLKCIKQNLEKSWDIFVDLILNPLLEPKEVETVRNQMISMVRQRKDNPFRHVIQIAKDKVFEGHPYSFDPYGSEKALSSISLQDLVAYHDSIVKKSKFLLIFAGDLKREVIENMLYLSLSTLPAGDYGNSELPPIKGITSGLSKKVLDLPTTYINAMFLAPNMNEDDYHAMRLAISILSDNLFEEIRTKKGMAYVAQTSMSSNKISYGNMLIVTTMPKEALNVAIQEIEKLKKEELSNKRLKESKNIFATSYYLSNEAMLDQASLLGVWEILGGGWQINFNFVEKIQSITPLDIMNVANKYFKNMNVGILGPNDLKMPEIIL